MRVRAIFRGGRVDRIQPLDDEARDLLVDDALALLAVQEANRRLAAGGVTDADLQREDGAADEWTPLAAIVLESARMLHT